MLLCFVFFEMHISRYLLMEWHEILEMFIIRKKTDSTLFSSSKSVATQFNILNKTFCYFQKEILLNLVGEIRITQTSLDLETHNCTISNNLVDVYRRKFCYSQIIPFL